LAFPELVFQQPVRAGLSGREAVRIPVTFIRQRSFGNRTQYECGRKKDQHCSNQLRPVRSFGALPVRPPKVILNQRVEMFEKREKTSEFQPKDGARPSLEAIMALQKMLEDGRLDQLDETDEAPPLEVRPSMDSDRAGRTRQADAVQSAPRMIGRFFSDLAHRLSLALGRKKPIGGKSARGSG
jgi:hypothetical protein